MIDGRTVAVACLACSLVLGTSACSNLRDAFGLAKRAPDEFAVVTKPPLVVPPDFSLRPPLPGGAAGPTSAGAAGEAKAALLGQGAATTAESQAAAGSVGEQALLARAGADAAAPDIRALILRETTQLEDRDPSFTERLIFWRRTPPGQVIDAGKEAERLRRAAASGRPPTDGETPVIQRRERGLLEDLF